MSASPWFHTHAHSRYSAMDAMPTVESMVAKVIQMGQPGLALTDHGNMAGSVRLYEGCMKAGIKPFPGFEGYLIDPNWEGEDELDGKAGRFHFGLLARNLAGYKALVRFNSMAHTRPRFNRFPRHTLQDLFDLGEAHGGDVILTTGCYFGLLQQTLVNKDRRAAKRVMETYAQWFPNTVVELQHHNTPHDNLWDDNKIVDILVDLAAEVGLPVMAAQDSHYLDREHKPAHDLLKRMYSVDGFPGDSYHLATAEWVASHYSPDVWKMVEETAEWLLEINELEIPPLDNYQARLPKMADHPDQVIRYKCRLALQEFLDRHDEQGRLVIPQSKHKAYWDRLDEELRVIKKVGQATYMLVVEKVIRYCREHHICVESRGSANGSLVGFLMGITQVDAVYWETFFERFMSEDRIKPPDVDIDIEDARRDEVVQWLGQEWDILRIGTWAALGARADNPERGSAMVSYIMYLNRLCEEEAKVQIEGEGGRKGDVRERARKIFAENFGKVEGMADIRNIDDDDHRALSQIIRMDSVTKSYGVHAGGILLPGSELDHRDYIPTMLVASSNTTVTQFDMDDVEKLGWQKLDLLGQASLSVMQATQRLLDAEDPADFTWIPNDDPEACKILREGRVGNGIFHFEGYTKALGGKELGIRKTRDAILAGALYMPGAMESGQKDHYVRARRDRAFRESVTYHSPIFERALAQTYGAVVYQEQPLQILRDYGMKISSINLLFKILKDSGKGAVERNAARLASLRAEAESLITDVDDFEDAWHQLTGFVAYGFNKAHATGYGIRSYRFAYLKAHFPLEFMTGLLTTAAGNADDERKYAAEARRIGIRILSPDVNISGVSWTIDRARNGIRKGLLSIKGVGPGCAASIVAHAPFKSIADLAARTDSRAVTGGKKYLETGELTGRLADLDNADALDSIKPD